MTTIEIISYTILSIVLIATIYINEKNLRNPKKPFNEKKFWEDRTKAYLEETKHIHKWKEKE